MNYWNPQDGKKRGCLAKNPHTSYDPLNGYNFRSMDNFFHLWCVRRSKCINNGVDRPPENVRCLIPMEPWSSPFRPHIFPHSSARPTLTIHLQTPIPCPARLYTLSQPKRRFKTRHHVQSHTHPQLPVDCRSLSSLSRSWTLASESRFPGIWETLVGSVSLR